MLARIEVTLRPEYDDPNAAGLLRRIELAHPEIRRRIRWGRSIDVYWLDLPCAREELIPACIDIFWDHVMQWLFTGNLIPSAAGKQGGVLDLMDASPVRPGNFFTIEKRFRAGVTDNVGRTALEAFEIVLGRKLEAAQIASGRMFLLEGQQLDEPALSTIARDVFCNELIETWTVLPEMELRKSDRFHQERIKRDLPKAFKPTSRLVTPTLNLGTVFGASSGTTLPPLMDGVDLCSLADLGDQELANLSHKKLWALSGEEMKAARDYFKRPQEISRRNVQGLSTPTDVEMEVIAQTWSEHCKHKIFGAKIRYQDFTSPALGQAPGPDAEIPTEIDGLFKTTIAETTQMLPKPWLLSVFDDNAGIVAFDQEDAFCIKVETHNSPSALDPYGGALTGVVGVNRDILGCGLGAKPIFNTDVFCVGPLTYSEALPERLMHPRRILDGVRRGVEHGGNKSGIPTVNGALVFDERYLGKPLVYCGTGGMMPRMSAGELCQTKRILPGDRILMVGGRIGKDGIHGATFSSLALDEFSPSSAVQLGDPITQKRMTDFLLEARDLGLYRAVTDNGAGGLSSSVGELARLSGGARMDVSRAKTKYPGLKPYELVVSESQERMTLAVPRDLLPAFLDLASRRGVETSDLGEFTDSGYFEILYAERVVASLNLEFLHRGVPRLQLEAHWNGPNQSARSNNAVPHGTLPARKDFQAEAGEVLLALLRQPNIASKEWLIRQYDHEVQGMSVIKPLNTAGSGSALAFSGPNDAAVVKPKPGSNAGIAVACGINPKLSDIDPFVMAQAVVDESVRNLLCVGAEFGTPESLLALVDNFCWPDPVGDPVKTGWLVRACFGMRDAALALGAPFVSGKDSMKNDYKGRKNGEVVAISVPPTLLITAVGRVPDVQYSRSADFKGAGESIYLLGSGRFGVLGSELASMLRISLDSEFSEQLRLGMPDWDEARRIYQWMGGGVGKEQSRMKAVHDVSEGGVLVAVTESLLARGLGATVVVPEGVEPWEFCFGEGFHSFIVSVSEADSFAVETDWTLNSVPFRRIGVTHLKGQLEVTGVSAGPRGWSVETKKLRQAWKREGFWE